MARREAVERNELKINDNISGTIITLYHKMPTTEERQRYQNMAVQRLKNKVKFQQTEARLKFGLEILVGFKEGDFERKVDGKDVPMASEPGSANYYEDWKPWVQANAADLVMLMAAHVFDSPAEIDDGEDLTGN